MDAQEDSTSQEVAASMELGPLEEYLSRLCPVMLDTEPAAFETALKAPQTQDKLKKFINDTKLPALLVRKRIVEGDEDTGGMIIFDW